MPEEVFVKVAGLSEADRLALESAFAQVGESLLAYRIWTEGTPRMPAARVVDGQSELGRQEALSAPASGDVQPRLIWIGPQAPASAWRSFERPIDWAEVIRAMSDPDQSQGGDDAGDSLDFDLGFSEAADTVPPDEPPARRVLIANADANERLYLRARLALSDLTQADEVETGAQVLERLKAQEYTLLLMDMSLPDVDGWTLHQQVKAVRPALGHIIMTKAQPSLMDHLRVRLSGVKAVLGRPLAGDKLQGLLDQIPD